MWKIGRIWLCSLWRLLVPRCCVVCGNTLQEGEEVVCLRCNMDLPRTGYHLKPDNPVERALWAKMPLVRASSYVYYRRGGSYASVLHLLKYKGRKDIALSLGKQAAAELMPSEHAHPQFRDIFRIRITHRQRTGRIFPFIGHRDTL